MANVFFDNPPILQGDERTRLEQLNGYLNTMSSKLNEALMALSVEEITVNAAEMARVQLSGGGEKKQGNDYEVLRSMIIKTATVVRHEMDEITAQLRDDFVAESELGDLETRIRGDFEATARGIMQSYDYDEKITTLEEDGETTKTYIKQFQGYIYSGILNEVTGEVGIAIGEGVTNDDGTLNSNNRWATFTANEISFWQGQVKLGYYAGQVFHITNGEVTGSLRIGNFIWKRMSGNGVALILDEA